MSATNPGPFRQYFIRLHGRWPRSGDIHPDGPHVSWNTAMFETIADYLDLLTPPREPESPFKAAARLTEPEPPAETTTGGVLIVTDDSTQASLLRRVFPFTHGGVMVAAPFDSMGAFPADFIIRLPWIASQRHPECLRWWREEVLLRLKPDGRVIIL